MKMFVLLLLLVGFVAAEEKHLIRAYRLSSLEALETVALWNVPDPFEEPEAFVDGEIKVVKLEPEDEELFKSRFFEGESGFEGVTTFMAKRFRIESSIFRAIYVKSSMRLVVRAPEEIHHQLRRHLAVGLLVMVKTQVTLLNLPRLERDMGWMDWENARGVSSLSGVSRFGTSLMLGNDVVTIDLESLRDGAIVENRFTFRCQGKGLLVKAGLILVPGVPRFLILGSPDGKRTWALKLEQDLVLANGEKWDDWILDEKVGSFLKAERLAGIPKGEKLKGWDFTKGVQSFPAPEFVYGDILPLHDESTVFPDHRTATGPVPFHSDHPELGKGKWRDLYEVSYMFRDDGGRLKMKKGELFLYRQSVSKYYAKMGPENLQILQQLIAEAKADLPMQLVFELVEIWNEEEMKIEDFQNAKMTRLIGGICLPGQSGYFEFGEGLGVQMELRFDQDSAKIEGRVTFAGIDRNFEKPELKTAFQGEPDKPMLLSQVFDGEKWIAKVLTVRVVTFGSKTN